MKMALFIKAPIYFGAFYFPVKRGVKIEFKDPITANSARRDQFKTIQ